MESDTDSSGGVHIRRSGSRGRRTRRFPGFVWLAVLPCSFVALCFSAYAVSRLLRDRAVPAQDAVRPAYLRSLPDGTNFGGWLVLEDWFFSGRHGTHVATFDESKGQGQCLPPLLPGVLEPWKSEGLLGYNLSMTRGRSAAVRIFEAHRNTYVALSDVQKLQDLGIRTVRVPIPWFTFADALAALDVTHYGMHNPDHDTVMVPDPYYVDSAMYATVPRQLLKTWLGHFKRYGLRAILDIHSMPGGSSQGTYNGVWPKKPAFWQHNVRVGATNTTLRQCGHLIASALISWVEELEPELRRAVAGITIMNEPAHMAAYNYGSRRFVDSSNDVLTWLSQGADAFRKSQLPKAGVKLYVNLIESSNRRFWPVVASWFRREFTKAEREEWAVFDKHWYAAWLGPCQGVDTGSGGYSCNDDPERIRSVVRHCVRQFAQDFIRHVPDGLKSNTEFSASTHENAFLGCGDSVVSRIFLEEQARVFADYGIESFFWTWKMPYGSNFELSWSLKRILGVEDTRSAYPCGPEFADVMA
eukprot:TRINITY_DN39567_c0_g1_i1.p1 TRINITY_DN39567_c0_g1~~TRINITY_DN39567_c0_g1_i1.p1  ORF type:complete len:540 (-),score=43.63 TRINITY_DN39567_c0_g1_i1:160-1740(-)